MKRSEINQIMRGADEFIRSRGFYLPPFAYWPPNSWREKGAAIQEILENQLGWDITDFGGGDFENTGLFLFTVRNGNPSNLKTGQGKQYAEKIMVVNERQLTPLHFHWSKTEDIINRGGGRLVVQLYQATSTEALDETSPVRVSLDGCLRELPAGGKVELTPGESITLPPYLYHQFWAEGGRTLVGEVSMVNDDATDNRFYQPVGRFPVIEEDEAPLYLLVTDYAAWMV